MKNQLFEDLIERIKELPTEILEEMRINMNEEQMRKDFEEWYDTYDIRTPQNPFDKEVAREAFKVSRESLVVELPHYSFTDYDDNGQYDHGYNTCILDVKEALESQGIKWK